MTLKIEVSGVPEARTIGENTFYSQEAWWHKEGSKHPFFYNLSVEAMDKGYPIGMYLMDDNKSTQIGQYNRMEYVRFPVLVSMKQS